MSRNFKDIVKDFQHALNISYQNTRNIVKVSERYLAELAEAEQSGGVDYSTDEQVIGTWINGKPLYQKTFTFDPPFSTTNEFALNLPSDAWIKDWEVYATDNVNDPVTISTGAELGVTNANYARIIVTIASGTLPYLTSGLVTVTVKYTKTSD